MLRASKNTPYPRLSGSRAANSTSPTTAWTATWRRPRRQVALYFEGEPGDREAITYAELQRRIARAANGLLKLGVRKGDRVVIYLPVIPETIIFTLACARIGAIHSLVFGGFSAEALKSGWKTPARRF